MRFFLFFKDKSPDKLLISRLFSPHSIKKTGNVFNCLKISGDYAIFDTLLKYEKIRDFSKGYNMILGQRNNCWNIFYSLYGSDKKKWDLGSTRGTPYRSKRFLALAYWLSEQTELINLDLVHQGAEELNFKYNFSANSLSTFSQDTANSYI